MVEWFWFCLGWLGGGGAVGGADSVVDEIPGSSDKMIMVFCVAGMFG